MQSNRVKMNAIDNNEGIRVTAIHQESSDDKCLQNEYK